MMAYQRQLVTAQEFDALLEAPENADRDFELIGGEIVEVPSNTQSSEIAMTIGTHFKMHLMQDQIEGHITGEAGLYDINGERYALDVAFKRSGTTRDYVDPNPPELVVEVVSPSDDPRQLSIKVSNYLAVGTVVWVVYSEDPQVVVHTPGKGAQIFTLDDTLTYDGLPDFRLPVRDIFA
jgi:Uma2 family endonuclease